MTTAVVLFSKDRAMQVDATLRSLFRHCQDPEQAHIQVLYKATDTENEANYARLMGEHPDVSFVVETDFKQQMISMLQPAEFVFFLVDDTLFVRGFSIGAAAGQIEQDPDVLGFSLRLGRNTTYNYVHAKPQPLPAFQQVQSDVLKYDWTKAKANFAYPLELSSSIYRQADILPLLPKAPFRTPNTLEASMARRTANFRATKPYLLCYETSAAFCNPVNKVQTDFRRNPASRTQHYGVDQLNRLFEAGYRVDVAQYDGWVPASCHQEVPLHFVDP